MDQAISAGLLLERSEVHNVRVQSPEWNWFAVAPLLFNNGRKGWTLGYYSPMEELIKTGTPLPGKLSIFNDCSYIFYGALLNILAYFSGKKISTLTLMVNGSGTKQVNIKVRQDLAILFLSHLVEPDRVAEPVKMITQPRMAQTLFS